jgi:hypothetical protein
LCCRRLRSRWPAGLIRWKAKLRRYEPNSSYGNPEDFRISNAVRSAERYILPQAGGRLGSFPGSKIAGKKNNRRRPLRGWRRLPAFQSKQEQTYFFSAAAPVPVRVSACVPPPLSVRVQVAVSAPTLDGLNVNVRVQVPPLADTEPPQTGLAGPVKSAALAPLNECVQLAKRLHVKWGPELLAKADQNSRPTFGKRQCRVNPFSSIGKR